ncbi:hypothetical protein ACOSP7_023331 [Xanthoceras sorbifolium]
MKVSLLLRHNTSSIASSSNTGMSLATEERWPLLTVLLSLKIQTRRWMTAPPVTTSTPMMTSPSLAKTSTSYASSRLFSHRLTTLDRGAIASVSISRNLEISGDGALLMD